MVLHGHLIHAMSASVVIELYSPYAFKFVHAKCQCIEIFLELHRLPAAG